MSRVYKAGIQVRQHGSKFCVAKLVGFGTRSIYQLWTGAEWEEAARLPVLFDSREEAGEYVDATAEI